MKFFNRLSVLATLAFCFSGYAIGVQPSADENGGRLKLYEKDDTTTGCNIDITPGIHSFYLGYEEGCQNDEYYRFNVEDMSSGVWIILGSEDWDFTCPAQKPWGWQEEIKTVKNKLTSPIKDISELGGATVDKLFIPGIVKTWQRDEGGESYDGRLSCVMTFWCPASAGPECEVHDNNHIIHHRQGT